jgi:uncharacterized membrane protein
MRSRWIGFAVAFLAGALSLWAYPKLPELVATHWNFRGEPDDYSSRLSAVLFAPLLIVGLRLLTDVLPRIDPRGRRYESFRDTYWLVFNLVFVFLGVLHVAVIGNALGWPVNINRVVPLGVGLLLVFLGNVLGRVEPNWFLGIRTPWTLSNDVVWRRVHRTAGWLFVGGGAAFMVMAFLPRMAVAPVFISTVIVIAVVPVLHSYLLWRRAREPGSRGEGETA